MDGFIRKLLLFLGISSLIFLCVLSEQPNIIFILADDLGWDDVSFHGSQQIPTPNIDTLAYDGIILANYYVQPICTPTRGALLTGRHPIHLGLQEDVISGAQPYGLPLKEMLLPQFLNTLGYRSHIVGKWHLGMFADEYTPTYRGFHSHYGYYQGNENYWDHTYHWLNDKMWGLDFHQNNKVLKTEFGKYSTNIFTDEAERIINEHNTSEPLFLYLPFQAVHSPLEAPYSYYEKFSYIKNEQRRIYAAMVSCLDSAVGNVTKALHNKGMLDNSVIVFSTDNGGPPNGYDSSCASNEPLRGTKRGLWEGGVRGAGLVWSPLLQTSGYTSHIMMQVIDWLPTLLSVSGYDMKTLPDNIDGIDQWTLLSAGEQKSVRTEMLHNTNWKNTEFALRINDMKLIYAKDGVTKSLSDWYKQEQLRRAQRNMEKHLETAPTHMFKSDLRDILQSMGRPVKEASTPYIVNCGPKPPDAAINCNVSVRPCLYNITADPCEYHNLADQMPEAVTKLMELFTDYSRTAIPPGNKPDDPKGYPSKHGGLWVPWVKLNEEEATDEYNRQ